MNQESELRKQEAAVKDGPKQLRQPAKSLRDTRAVEARRSKPPAS
jgi:hypothetical protein